MSNYTNTLTKSEHHDINEIEYITADEILNHREDKFEDSIWSLVYLSSVLVVAIFSYLHIYNLVFS